MAQVDPKTLGINLHIIIGAVVLLSFLFVVIIVAWTAAKAGMWQLRRKRAAGEEQRRRHGAAGQPYPPAGRGLCDRCGGVYDKVYHLPAGPRYCPTCSEETPKEPR